MRWKAKEIGDVKWKFDSNHGLQSGASHCVSVILVIHVTSFSSISYCSNSEYWTQKYTQNGNIHSIILDVYDER